MKTIYTLAIAIVLATQGAFSQTELPAAFTDGLKRAKMEFRMPEGFSPTSIIENPHMNYEYAIKNDTVDLEIRYAIRPLDYLIQRYEKNQQDTSKNIGSGQFLHKHIHRNGIQHRPNDKQQPDFQLRIYKRNIQCQQRDVFLHTTTK